VLVLHGSRGFDLPHVALFDCPATAQHWILPGAGHDVAADLRRRDRLTGVTLAALSGDRGALAQQLREAGAEPRHSPRARRALALGRAIYAVRGVTGYEDFFGPKRRDDDQ
jgi:hypothetical protein